MKKSNRPKMSKVTDGYYYILFALLILISFGRSISNQFSLDDNYYVLNPNVQNGLEDVKKYFTEYTIKTPGENHGYRPITALTFGLEKHLFGELSPFRDHMISLILYFFVCILLYRLLEGYIKSITRLTAVVITILFLLHPIHTEVVFNIKCRDELLATIGGLSSIILVSKFLEMQRWQYLLGSLLALILGLLSKPTAISFLGLIPFSLWYFGKISLRVGLATFLFASILGLGLIKGVSKILVKEESKREFFYYENPIYVDKPGVIDRIPTAASTLNTYLAKLVFPYPLSCYYGYAVFDTLTWRDWNTWAHLIVILALIFCIAIFSINYPTSIFGLLWLLLTLSLYSNFFRPAPGIIADRFTFIGSMGYCILVGSMISHKIKRLIDGKTSRRWSVGLLTGLTIIVVSAVLWNNTRALHWKSKIDLLRQDVIYYPESAKLNTLLANEAYRLIPETPALDEKVKLVDEAVRHYKQAIRIYPDHAFAWNNLGTMYGTFHKDYEKAIEAYQRALTIKPNYPTASYSLAYCYEQTGTIDLAIKFYQHTLAMDDKFERARLRLADLVK